MDAAAFYRARRLASSHQRERAQEEFEFDTLGEQMERDLWAGLRRGWRVPREVPAAGSPDGPLVAALNRGGGVFEVAR